MPFDAPPETLLVLLTAATVGVTHTAIGIDHTLPFILLARARAWSLRRTLTITLGCAVAHVLSSVAIGAFGYWGLGFGLAHLEAIEGGRGDWAAWLLIAFGAVYGLHGAWRLRQAHGHHHVHVHADGTVHDHAHDHEPADGTVVHHHGHRRSIFTGERNVLSALLVIFLLGPCEPLIPLMIAPAFGGGGWGPWGVALVFGSATALTMLGIVLVGVLSLERFAGAGRFAERLEPHLQWLAGLTIAFSGLGVELFGI